MKFWFCLISLWGGFFSFSQRLITDSTFVSLQDQWLSEEDMGWQKTSFSKGQIVRSNHRGAEAISFKFKVSSVQVDPNFMMAKLNQEMKAGEVFSVKVTMAKDKFSAFRIKEFQVAFVSNPFASNRFMHGVAAEQIVGFNVESLQDDWLNIEMDYVATGGEEYLLLGSLGQKFGFGETNRLGNMLADRSYQELPSNSTYYVANIQVVKKGVDVNLLRERQEANRYVLGNENNLILNGGAEITLSKRYFVNEYLDEPGTLIAPFVYSLTPFCPLVDQVDSNEYRSVYEANQLGYMGNGQFLWKVLSTNWYHQYGKAVKFVPGKEYNSHYYYEDEKHEVPAPYAMGSYLTLVLKEELISGQDYTFSCMMKIQEGASFGVPYVGIHFLEELSNGVKDSLWKKDPDEILPISSLTKSQAWHELKVNYRAKGGERYLVLGHLPEVSGIIRNQFFKPQVSSSCGPREYNCLDYYVYFKDSLFAGYQLDNAVLCQSDQSQTSSASFYPLGKRVQMEIIFDELVAADGAEENLDKAKRMLIEAQEVLRNEDAICIVDQRKKDPLTLDPYPIINKRKIIRKINQPKLIKKKKIEQLPAESILFGDLSKDQFIHHLMIVVDESTNLDATSERLQNFIQSGGNLTLLYIGAKSQGSLIEQKWTQELSGAIFLDLNEEDNMTALITVLANGK